MTTEYIVTVERSDPGHGPMLPSTQTYRDNRYATRAEAEARAYGLRHLRGTRSVTVTEVPAV